MISNEAIPEAYYVAVPASWSTMCVINHIQIYRAVRDATPLRFTYVCSTSLPNCTIM